MFCKFVGAGLKPARYGNRLVRQNVEVKNELERAGFKPAPAGKCPYCKAGLESPACH